MRLQVALALFTVLIYGKPARGQWNCKQDILLILDTSLSIGKVNFEQNVKPFLKQLVDEPRLNIGPHGTHLAIMVFSSEPKTKILLPFNSKYDKNDLAGVIDLLNWDTLKGGHTRTDVALSLANQVFLYDNPRNRRATADDVVILITDGHPQGIHNAVSEAEKEAKILKDKNILIIGVAVGDAVKRSTYMNILENLSTPGQTLKSAFGNINIITDALVARTCQSSPALDCSCSPVHLGDPNLTPGSSSVTVNWKIPEPDCESELESVTPNVSPGDSFPAGQHIIQYTYKIENNDLVCNVSFEVKGSQLCRGQVFTDTTHVCCCGALHRRRPAYKCCGVDYYSTLTEKCCPYFNIKSKEKSCAGPAASNFYSPDCTCPAVSLGTSYTVPGVASVPVKWTIPKPNCPSTLQTVTPRATPGQRFPVGRHTIKYTYQSYDRFEAMCEVHFEVKGCSCRSITLSPQHVTPGRTMKRVQWTRPRPNCQPVQLMSSPAKQSGQYFSIGFHRARYVYQINKQHNVTCGVAFEIRGALCRNKGYNAATQVCCCGVIHTKRSGYRCCVQDYYETRSQKCCSNVGARHRNIACPRQ